MTPGSGLSPNLQHLETSATIAISQEAKRRKAAGEDVIDLGAGEPDFPTPSLPSDAGVRAIREGKTHYPARSEEHTSELQSPYDLVCRLLLENKKIYVGDGSSDIHVMLHVNRSNGLTIA